jgi:hypothetical protein
MGVREQGNQTKKDEMGETSQGDEKCIQNSRLKNRREETILEI